MLGNIFLNVFVGNFSFFSQFFGIILRQKARLLKFYLQRNFVLKFFRNRACRYFVVIFFVVNLNFSEKVFCLRHFLVGNFAVFHFWIAFFQNFDFRINKFLKFGIVSARPVFFGFCFVNKTERRHLTFVFVDVLIVVDSGDFRFDIGEFLTIVRLFGQTFFLRLTCQRKQLFQTINLLFF